MSAQLRRKVVLVTSGLGTAHGGIGVVSQSILKALAGEHEVALWRHPVALPRFLRKGMFAALALWGSLRVPDFVFYEHVHLAAIHHLLPQLKEVPYGVFLHGIEVWEPLVSRRREALLRANILLANSATTVAAARAVNPWLPEVKVTWLGVPRREAAVRGRRTAAGGAHRRAHGFGGAPQGTRPGAGRLAGSAQSYSRGQAAHRRRRQ